MEDESDDKDDTKRKSRNLSEKKRRDQFNTLVNDLNALISTSSRKMDKSTVLRSTIAFLKHHNEAADRSKVFEIQQDWKPSFLTNDEFTHLMLEALDGFIIVFSSSGSIYYASESITSLLGYLPRDILNMTVFDLTYGMDHDCLKNIFLNPMPVIEPFQTDITASNQITFHAHMKRGGIDKVDANAYELVKFVGYFRNDANVDNLPVKNTQSPPHKIPYIGGNQATEVDKKLVFVGTGRVQTPQLIREMSAIDPTRNEFTSKHSMEWKFLFLDHRAPPIIGYMPFEVLGTSGYDYYHFDDLEAIVACHEELMQKGEGKSCYYRFLTKGQQWIWLQTEFFVSYHQYNPKPEYVVCTHKVVSYADVIKQNKASKKCSKTYAVNVPTNKTSTMTLQDIETNNSNSLGACIQTAVLGSNASPILLNDIATTYDATSVWPGTVTTTPTQANPHKTSRPSSGYDNISSTGISPNLKRKRYFHHHSRGNESDSTSMSADSGTSRHSLLTHLSSHSRHRQSFASAKLHQNPSQHQQHQQQNTQNHLDPQQQHQTHPHQTSFHQTHQQTALRNISNTQSQPNVLPTMLQQHSIASEPMLTPATPCQFTQTAFPLHNAPIVAPTFLEPSQFLAAIPVQPVIAPFPVTPVSLSPIAVSLPNVVTKPNPALQTSLAQHRSDMVPGAAVVIRPTQTHLQDQLQRKHDELQSLIMQQQDELRIVSEQLLLARYTLLQPVLPMNYNNASGGSMRNFNFANNNNSSSNINNNNIASVDDTPKQPHVFSHHDFNLNAEHDQLLHQAQQVLLPQQQVLQQHQAQQQQILPHQQQHQQQQLQLQQQQQQSLQQQHHSLLSNSQQLHQHQQQLLQTQQQQQQLHQSSPLTLDQENLLARSVPDLEHFGQDDIDVFLNLSPLLGCSEAILNSTTGNSNNNSSITNNNNNNNNLTNLNSSISNNIEKLNTFSNNTQHNDDSLLSYMQQKSIEPSPGLNFQMGLSEDDSETHSEDAKLLNSHTQHHLIQQQQQQQHQSQQQNSSFFPTNSFQAVNQVTNSADKIPNDLEILPFQMSQEQSRNIFRPPHTRRTSQ